MTVTQKRQTIANNTNSKNAVQPVLFNKLHHEIKKTFSSQVQVSVIDQLLINSCTD